MTPSEETRVLGYQNASKALSNHTDDEDRLNNILLSSLVKWSNSQTFFIDTLYWALGDGVWYITLFYKSLVCPLEAIPTRHEDSTTDVLVKHKGEPHSYKSEAEHNTEKIAETNAYKPLYDDSEIEWEEYITRCTKSVCSPYIDAFSDLKQYIHPETPAYKIGDVLIIR